ncbi:hypothetical protein QFC22_005004 [Naganishia vaughanmartiniae]|uniref:Uncharacterized protein n=1 Tax=Naganishia vaughanmartiniae TaxID=1424756 RepID=A0ACC2WZB7_9TREE|nr:hypothetical protein QFC22_005004 [Naganishia vaughanmartiniae]
MVAVVVDLPASTEAAASGSGKGRCSIRLSILNRHPEQAWQGDLTFMGFQVDKVETYELYSDNLTAVNSFEKPENVVPKVSHLTGDEWTKTASKYTVKKHSWQFLIFEGKYTK